MWSFDDLSHGVSDLWRSSDEDVTAPFTGAEAAPDAAFAGGDGAATEGLFDHYADFSPGKIGRNSVRILKRAAQAPRKVLRKIFG